jgi:hypothetical protein
MVMHNEKSEPCQIVSTHPYGKIITKPFQPTRQELFKVLMENSLKRTPLIFILLAFLVVIEALQGVFLMAAWFAALFLLLLALSCWRHTSPKYAKTLLMERYYEIDENFFTGYLSDGSLDKINWGNVTKVVRAPRSYHLYLSRASFIYVPIIAFASEQDRTSFDALLNEKRFLPRGSSNRGV